MKYERVMGFYDYTLVLHERIFCVVSGTNVYNDINVLPERQGTNIMMVIL